VQQAEAEKELWATVVENQHHVGFLEAELAFSEHLAESLKDLQWMDSSLDQVEQLAGENHLLEALKVLDGMRRMLFFQLLLIRRVPSRVLMQSQMLKAVLLSRRLTRLHGQ
jgi:predicted phosphatase